jgi:GNAT superfamily N-acetyltransferase
MTDYSTSHNHELLNLYTHHVRRYLVESGFRREETPPVVRYVNHWGTHSLILYSELDGMSDEEIGAVAEREAEYFRRLGHSFEWKVFDYDTPENLRFILQDRGYQVEPEETLMVLDISRMPDTLVPDAGPRTRRHRPCMPGGSLAPRPVTDPEEIPAILSAVQNRAFRSTFDISLPSTASPSAAPPAATASDHAATVHHPLEDELKARMAEASETMAFYVIRDGDRPVSAAWTLYFGDSPTAPIAGFYGGATLPEYRRRGLYTALVSARARAARDRGIRYVTVDAGAMSRPILEHLGFRKLASTWPVSSS